MYRALKSFYEFSTEHAMKIINFEKKKMIPLSNEQQESFEKTKICNIWNKKFEHKYINDKIYRKIKDHCHNAGKYRGAALSICKLKYSIPKEIPMIFHNGSNYDYHFIIKDLAKEFQRKFNGPGRNTEKKIFSVPITKEVKRFDKNGKEITKTISYKLQFIDRARFMPSLVSDFVDNLAERFHKIKCKNGHDNKKCETYRNKLKDCECCIEYTTLKMV